jgi:hypothetical protein
VLRSGTASRFGERRESRPKREFCGRRQRVQLFCFATANQALIKRFEGILASHAAQCAPIKETTHFYGALNLAIGQETVMHTTVMNSEVTTLFLLKLLAAYPERLILPL